MKKDELRRLLKPLVKQCIKEVLFEKGILSNIVSEIMVGLNSGVVLETKTKNVEHSKPAVQKLQERQSTVHKQKIQEKRHQMLEAIGQSSYNGVDLFENTEPLAKGGDPASNSPSANPLSGMDPSDAGVDISGFMDKSNIWKSLVGGSK
tara:strand:+ start:79 stop:525 length:447 start_codon:yes stop_codon:yes gene_type:complete